MYPQVEINLSAIRENTRKIVELGQSQDIEIAAVTKGVCADTRVVKAIVEGGATFLADSRIQNIIKMKNAGIKAPFMLIRAPMHSEVENVVKYVDYSVNTEIGTLRKLNLYARKHDVVKKVIIMIDVGDRREGLMPDTLPLLLEKAKTLQAVEIVGIGTHVGCFGGVLPTVENHTLLVKYAGIAEKILGHKMGIVSTGGSVALKLIEEHKMPTGVTQLRTGEAILLGTDTTGGRTIPWLRQDAFTLHAEVIEVQRKPSVPSGPRGRDATGKLVEFEDRGIRKRAILAVGLQDVEINGLKPMDDKIEILGGSSDHIIADVEDANVSVGDVVKLRPHQPSQYMAMLRFMTSPYVEKKYKE